MKKIFELIKEKSNIRFVICCFSLFTACSDIVNERQKRIIYTGDKITSVEFYSHIQSYIVCVHGYEYMIRSGGGIILLIKEGVPAECK